MVDMSVEMEEVIVKFKESVCVIDGHGIGEEYLAFCLKEKGFRLVKVSTYSVSNVFNLYMLVVMAVLCTKMNFIRNEERMFCKKNEV